MDIRTAKRFEAFKEQLRAEVPLGQAKSMLDLEIEFALQGLCKVAKPIPHTLIKFTSLAMAKDGFKLDEERIVNPVVPAWVDTARDEISGFIGNRPSRQVLLDSVFFTGELSELRTLDRLTSALVEPQGDYDPHAFAAGIVMGKLGIELRND